MDSNKIMYIQLMSKIYDGKDKEWLLRAAVSLSTLHLTDDEFLGVLEKVFDLVENEDARRADYDQHMSEKMGEAKAVIDKLFRGTNEYQ